MRIQHNIMAMNAYRNYNTNNSALSKNLEKLSSGYAINRAGDDAAGLAISEKMRAQITGLDTAQKNAKDGISLVQTAEGALTEVHDMLNRMVELATQSANGTYENETDRAQLQKEVAQLQDEIDRIADSANFNGINLLNGDYAGTTTGGVVATDGVSVGSTDGQAANSATEAKITLDFTGATTGSSLGADAGIFSGLDTTATVSDIGTLTANGVKLSDIFSITGSNGKFTLTAKTAGTMNSATWNSIVNETSSVLNIDAVNGTNRGEGSAATKAEYEIKFDLTKVSAGDSFQIGSKTFKFTMDSNATDTGSVTYIKINDLNNSVIGTSATKGQIGMANAIQSAINAAFNGNYTVDGALTTTAHAAIDSNGVYTIKFKANTAGVDGNMGEVRVSANDPTAVDATYTEGKPKGAGTPGTFATVTYDFDLGKLAVGNKITIGTTTIEIVADSQVDEAAGKISLSTAKDGEKLAKAFEAKGYNAGQLSFNGGKLTITDTQEGRTGEVFAKQTEATVTFDAGSKAEASGGLVLQIGDTSDEFNKLEVRIEDMHAKSLGVDVVDIGTQDGAQKAVDIIKEAINKVSDVRGGLGATQNRLDHTINNLSVMEENIQDAESTIRDTDVAEEMMAYTKNNILIQSAQAMLAQANQVPQGVLQLLG